MTKTPGPVKHEEPVKETPPESTPKNEETPQPVATDDTTEKATDDQAELESIPTPKMHAPSIPLPPGGTVDVGKDGKSFIGPIIPSSHHLAAKQEVIRPTAPEERFQPIGPNDPLVFNFKKPPPIASKDNEDVQGFEIPSDQEQKYKALQEQAKKHANRIQRLAIGEDVSSSEEEEDKDAECPSVNNGGGSEPGLEEASLLDHHSPSLIQSPGPALISPHIITSSPQPGLQQTIPMFSQHRPMLLPQAGAPVIISAAGHTPIMAAPGLPQFVHRPVTASTYLPTQRGLQLAQTVAAQPQHLAYSAGLLPGVQHARLAPQAFHPGLGLPQAMGLAPTGLTHGLTPALTPVMRPVHGMLPGMLQPRPVFQPQVVQAAAAPTLTRLPTGQVVLVQRLPHQPY